MTTTQTAPWRTQRDNIRDQIGENKAPAPVALPVDMSFMSIEERRASQRNGAAGFFEKSCMTTSDVA